jgi:hypothetical protein
LTNRVLPAPSGPESSTIAPAASIASASAAPQTFGGCSRAVAGEAVSQAAVAEMVAAEVISAIGVDVDPGPLEASASASRSLSLRREPSANECAPHALPKLPAFLAPLVANLESADVS